MNKTMITKQQIKHLASLAQLQITDEQVKKFQDDLSEILAYIEKVKKLDLKDITETSRISEEINILRDDSVEPSFTQKQALQNAKKTHNGYFVVPRIIDKE